MKYEKPSLVVIASACSGIQNNYKCACIFFDLLLKETLGAYEADE
jgi:hypothetical protein